MLDVVTVDKASTKPRTAAIMAISVFSLLIAEPTPIPAAPAAIAIGAVTLEMPEAHNTGTETAREISKAAAKVGAAFSINPKVPG